MYPSLYNSVIPKMLSIAHGYERENESSLIVTDATQQIVNDFCRRSMGGKNKANAIEWFYFVPPRSVIFKWTIATHPRDETRFGFREYPLPVVFALFPALKSKPRTFHASADESSNFFSILLFFLFFFFFVAIFVALIFALKIRTIPVAACWNNSDYRLMAASVRASTHFDFESASIQRDLF